MSEKLVLDLPVLLPDALDGRDQCVQRLTTTLTGSPGLDRVHLVDAADGAPARLCMHYDPATTNVARIRTMAESAGASLTEQFRHVLWSVSGVNHVRKARTVAERVSACRSSRASSSCTAARSRSTRPRGTEPR